MPQFNIALHYVLELFKVSIVVGWQTNKEEEELNI